MQDRYNALARGLHWSIAVLVIFLIGLGLALKYDLVPRSAHHVAALIHIGGGLTVLGLMLARLAVRLAAPPPKLPAAIPAAERALACAGHFAMYALLFAMPVFGIVFEQAHGRVVSWFGLAALPTLVGKNDALRSLFYALHFWGGLTLIALLAAHFAALIRHRRQGVNLLRRMLG